MCSFDFGGPVEQSLLRVLPGGDGERRLWSLRNLCLRQNGLSLHLRTASTMLAPKLFKPFEIETGKSTWLLGLAGITERAIPMAIEDPLRVIG